MFNDRIMGQLESIVWILIAVAFICLILYRNRKLTNNLNNVDQMIEESNAKCDQLFQEIKDANKEIKIDLLNELEHEAQKFVQLSKDKKASKGQEAKIRDQINKIYSYIESSKEVDDYYVLDDY